MSEVALWRSRRVWGMAAAAAISLAIGACADLRVGPPPTSYVGPAQAPAALDVGPTTPPAATRPDQMMPAVQMPGTQPAATEPTASGPGMPLPATLPGSTLPGSTLPGSTLPGSTLPSPTPTGVATSGPSEPAGPPLVLGVEQAILLGLEQNPNLAVQKLTPLLRYDTVQQQRAVFDPTLSATLQGGRTGRGPTSGSAGAHDMNSDNFGVDVGASQYLPTGTTIQPDLSTNFQSAGQSFGVAGLYGDSWTTRAGLSVTQALLQGADINANLAALRSAKIDVAISQYQLRGFAEQLVSSIEQTYWDYELAKRQIAIYEQSVQLAQQQLDQTDEFIKVGKVAQIERAAAVAEVAQRRLGLITARSTLEQTRLKLLQLLGGGGRQFFDHALDLTDQPFVPEIKLDSIAAHMKLALQMRTDLNQARLQIQQGTLAVVRTKNGLLPKLDLFVTMGKSGYASSFGDSVENMNGPNYDVSAGLRFDFPPLNRAAEASYHQSVTARDQQILSLENLTQLAEVDVRSAYIDVERFRATIPAAQASRVAQEAALDAEQEKFRVGRSTTLLVAQAQQNLLQAQIAEIQAVTGYLKSLVVLYQQEGTLLVRRHIAAPGERPVAYQEGAPGTVVTGFAAAPR